ncbi:MAG TPA: SRPBCC family protein [Candidatus Limnocylindrales bacterium]|nr:SRPBCC family protein [Candidatus Limnocylindrales bacterium]
MPDFERSITVPVDPDTAFDYVSDPRHLPEFVATMTGARRKPGQQKTELHVTAEVDGRHEEGDTRFRTDRWSKSVDWGTHPDYRGTMRVERADDAGSRISLLLRIRDPRGEDRHIERVMDQTMTNLAERLGSGA